MVKLVCPRPGAVPIWEQSKHQSVHIGVHDTNFPGTQVILVFLRLVHLLEESCKVKSPSTIQQGEVPFSEQVNFASLPTTIWTLVSSQILRIYSVLSYKSVAKKINYFFLLFYRLFRGTVRWGHSENNL